MSTFAVSAPGKLYVAGEYAVVEPGHPAILVAVDRFLTVELEPAAHECPPRRGNRHPGMTSEVASSRTATPPARGTSGARPAASSRPTANSTT